MSAFPLMCNVEHTRQHRAAIERQSPVKMFIGRILNDDVAELITVAEDSNTEVINAPSIPTASPPISPNLSPAIITPAHHAHKVHHMIDMTAVSRCFYQAETFFCTLQQQRLSMHQTQSAKFSTATLHSNSFMPSPNGFSNYTIKKKFSS